MNNDKSKQDRLSQTYEALRDFDPIKETEELLKHNNEGHLDDGIVALQMNAAHGRMKERVLNEMDDTTFNMDFDPYIDLAHRLGFETAYTEQFIHYDSANNEMPIEGRDETMMILAHRELGLVLVVDSFTWESGNKHRNSSHLYFTWKPFVNDGSWYQSCLSSGGWESSEKDWRNKDQYDRSLMFWSGHNDVREGLRFQMGQLTKHGTLFAQWPEHRVSGLMFSNWGDFKTLPKDSTVEKFNKIHRLEYARFMKCPKWFQQIINGNFKEKK